MYSECVEKLQGVTKTPTQYLEANENFCNGIKGNLKELYHFAKTEEIKTIKSNALYELIIENFDLEQIWQQIELQNDSIIPPLLTAVSKLLVDKSGHSFVKQATHESKDNNSDNEKVESNGEESISESGDEKSEEEVNLEDIGSNDEDEEMENKADRNIKSSIVDDEFFKLAEMERFLETEEKKMNDPDSGNDSDDQSESEVSIDLFEGGITDDHDDEDKMKTAKYKDFYDKKRDAQKRFTSDAEKNEHLPSTFELRQTRLGKKIEEIEENAVQDKSWQLKGEIMADNRPQNSLLEEIVEFDLTTKPAPVMTEQTTMQLEDIIKQRIKDRTFDSVERKIKPVDTLHEFKKKLVLDQEKSKESLAQIYEKEYLEKQAAFDNNNAENGEKEPELHQEINLMITTLFVKLDALSNFHFTPKPAIPELKVVSNLPAVSMEEVAPVATSGGALLAPEEIRAKSKGDFIGKNERTITDKKRERRKKKLKQKIRAKEKQRKEHSSHQTDYARKKKQKKTGKIDEHDGSERIKSSKAFFTQLQDQVQSHVKRKSFSQQRKVDASGSNAKKLKL